MSVGNGTLNRQITNMRAGTQATDAVNVAQLTPVVTALGGGASINATTGAVTGPTYNLTNGGRQTTVGGALSALDGALTTAKGDITNINNRLGTVVTNDYIKIDTGSGAEAAQAAASAVAIGSKSQGSGVAATVVGNNTVASSRNSSAFGFGAQAAGGTGATMGAATAIGAYANASGYHSSALGVSAVASGSESVALGVNSVANRDNSVSVGSTGNERQITNVRAGTQNTDAVNLAQLNAAIAGVGPVSTAYFKANGAGDGSDDANAVGVGSVAVGANASTVADGGVAIGNHAASTMANGVAIGNGTTASLDGVAIGRDAHAQNTNAIAFGTSSTAADNGISLGYNARSGSNAMALGANTAAVGNNSVALGNGSVASVANTVSVGSIGNERKIVNVDAGNLSATSTDAINGSQLFATNTRVGSLEDSLKGSGLIDPVTGESLAVAYDDASKSKATLGGANGTTLSNVAAGEVNATSKDAINGSQLFGTAQSVADALGGGSAVNPDGTVSAPSYQVGGTTVGNVGDALTNLDGRTTANTGDIADLKDKFADSGLVDDNGNALAAVTYDKKADGTPNYDTITLGGGKAAGPVALKNVAQGVDGTDAVNVDQLTDATQSIRNELADGTLDMKYIKVNATGTQANAMGVNSVAIGSAANANGVGALALGTGARAAAAGAVAIGLNSVANQANTVSVGSMGNERKIVNVAAGDLNADSTDAVNGSQLYDALNSLSATFDEKTQQLSSRSSRSLGVDSIGTINATGPLVAVEGLQGDNLASLNGADPATTTAAAIGVSSAASGGNAVAVGLQNVAGSDNSVAIGSFAQTGAGQSYSVAVGSDVQTNGTQAVAIGAHVQANADNALAIGSNDAYALGASTIALGDGARVRTGAENSIAVGKSAGIATNVTNAIALGAGSTVAAGANGGIALGQGSVANRGNALSVGGGTVGTRQIINVTAGTQQTDAVNVSQLTGVTNALGGGAGVGGDGRVTQPTYNVGGTDYHNVGDALDALAANGGTDPNAVAYDDDTKTSVTLGGANAAGPVALKNVANGVDDHDAVNVAQLKDAGLVGDDGSGNLTSMALTYDDASKDKATLGGANGTTLSNVAAGEVSATSMDAINGSQLHGTAQSVADALGGGSTVNPDGTLGAPSYQIGGSDFNNVGDALTNLDGRTTANTGDISDLKDKLSDSGLVDPTTGKSLAAVTYDKNADGTPNYGSVTLGGENAAGPVALKNVAAGKDDTDAVNVAQLKDTGLVGDDGSGNLTSMALTYDDASKDKATLGGANGTTLSNVAAGEVSATSMDAINGSQLHGTAQSVADALGGGSTVNPDGTLGAPSYQIGGSDFNNVGDALTNLDGRTTANTGDISDLKDKLSDSGLVDPTTGKSLAAVTYDKNADGTPNYGSVTLGGENAAGPVQLKNVAAGKDDTDAVNVAQLKDTGLVGDDGSGNLTSLAVTYDDASKTGITLGNAGTPVAIHNVAAGDVSATSTDAVNGSQLFATNQSIGDLRDSLKDGGVIDPTTGESLAVVYDSNAKDQVTLGGANAAGPVALKNVAAGKDDTDAVNVAQLKDTGLVGDDGSGNLTSMALTYDDASKDKATLGGANGTTLSNVAAGEVSATSMDAINGSQLHGTAQSVADALGGSSTVNPDGTLGAPSYQIGGSDFNNVGDALTNLDGRTTANTGDISDLKDKLSDSGLVDPTTGKSLAAVTYDKNADGTPNYGSVTLGGEGAATPVQLKNVAAGKDDTDAVNVAQLKDAGLVGEGDDGNLTSLAVTYDDASKTGITLGNAGTPVAIHNVAAGDVSATSTDAVNGSQLFATNQSIGDLGDKLKDSGLVDPTTGQSLAAVTYDRNADGTPNYGSVTLGGEGAATPVQLKNVAAGVDDTDAVNVAQLRDAGLVAPVDPTNPGAGLESLAVTYGTNPDGSANFDAVALKGGANGTTLSNVAAGEVSATSKDAINGSQLFGTAQSVADALGGGSTVNPDGTIGAPSYQIGGSDFNNVGDALTNLDGRTTANTGDISDLKDKLSDSGLVDPATGKSLAAVTYDKNADGTPNYGSVTLGGANGSSPVALKNVAQGTDGTDAVNVDQLTSGLSNLREDLTNGAIDLKFIKVNADPATGVAAIASGAQAVAIGTGAAGTGAHALALGTGARASATDAVAIGYNSVASQANTVSVGRAGSERRIVNVADGNVAFESTDAVNGGQLYAAMNSLTTTVDTKTQQAIDSFSSSLDQKTQAAIDQMNAKSAQLMDVTDPLVAVEGLRGDNLASLNGADPATKSAVAVGVNSTAAGGDTIAIGLQTYAGADNSVAIGSFAQTGAGDKYSVAMGSNAQTTGEQAVALGANVESGAANALVVGSNNAKALGASSIAMGDGALTRAGTTNSIAMGKSANVATNVADAIALGANATVAAGATGGIALGAGSIANRDNALSIGSVGAERQIINVKAGTQQTDAVNVSQLNGVTTALGGGAAVGADGSIVQPTYTVDGKQYSTVGEALDALAASGGGGEQPAEGAVAYDDASKSSVTLAGADGTTIGNLKAGEVSATSMDAINGSQLHGTAQSVADALGGGSAVNPDGTIGAPTYTVGGTDVHNVGDALTNLDGRVTTNTGDIAGLKDQLAGSGLVDPTTGQSIAAVTYDRNADGTPNYGSVTLGNGSGPVRVSNVADGVDRHDAVNLGQLQDAGLVAPVDPTNPGSGLASLAVTYGTNDDGSANFDEIALKGGANGTTLTNVAAGEVSETSKDAVNGSQLYATNTRVGSLEDSLHNSGLIDPVTGESLAVVYDSAAKDHVTLGGANASNPVVLSNVAAGVAGTDAVNVDQLSGALKDIEAGANPLGVQYDSIAMNSVTLGGMGSTTPVVLTNVANGSNPFDAVNYGQLSELSDRIGSMDDRVGRLEEGAGPGDGSGGGSGGDSGLGDLIGGSGEGGSITPVNPGTGDGNVAIGSGGVVKDGVDYGTAVGSNSSVGGTGGTAIGSGSNAAAEGSTAIGQGSSATGNNSVAIGSGSVATEANTVSFGNGTDDGNRRVVNIADGINASDAATKGQLDRAVGGLQGQINDVSKNAYSGIAAATALTMIPGVDPGKTLSFGVGGATYKGYQAVAFGGEARITQNLKMKAGVGLSSGGNTVGVGASYQW
ncbi:YadA-like family protein [Burkholderia stabilis]|uniref:YadA-like family protein n=1 Tax=Burkholderia stabilis TaxID=95485 RepID=UPI001E2A4612|nr:YadA-like family protein [Burkholderia stabilis]